MPAMLAAQNPAIAVNPAAAAYLATLTPDQQAAARASWQDPNVQQRNVPRGAPAPIANLLNRQYNNQQATMQNQWYNNAQAAGAVPPPAQPQIQPQQPQAITGNMNTPAPQPWGQNYQAPQFGAPGQRQPQGGGWAQQGQPGGNMAQPKEQQPQKPQNQGPYSDPYENKKAGFGQ